MTEALALFVAACALGAWAVLATLHWIAWRSEAQHWRDRCQDMLKDRRARFLSPPPLAQTFDEIDRVRAEMLGQTGISNVIEVQFGKKP